MSAKEFRVGVFTDLRDGLFLPRVRAYTMWYNPDWPGCCEHIIMADTGAQAKQSAIKTHKQFCLSGRVEQTGEPGDG